MPQEQPATGRSPFAPLVLVVDDARDGREMYAEFLTYSGFRTVEARDGAEAIRMTRTHRPDLIVMDLSMPVVDGWTAIAALKENPQTQQIPIIALSGFTMMDERGRALDAGADLFLARPCLPDDLVRYIDGLLRRP